MVLAGAVVLVALWTGVEALVLVIGAAMTLITAAGIAIVAAGILIEILVKLY